MCCWVVGLLQPTLTITPPHHSGLLLSLAIPSWVGAMSISQRVVTPCGWGVKAGMVRVRVAGKPVWSPCYQFGDRCFANAVEQSAWTVSATGHHLRTIQTIVENVYVWLVSWAVAPCVWALRALTRNLLTYLLCLLVLQGPYLSTLEIKGLYNKGAV